jgi:Uri superfamily endonuclease
VNASRDLSNGFRSEAGSYVLLLDLAGQVRLEVGRLGCVSFESGRYAYFGSALGSGGVAARVRRHLRAGKAVHWHIDYLTAVAPIAGVAIAYGAEQCECAWSHALQALQPASTPVRGFGSSDCRRGCPAHLWRLPDALPLLWFEDELTRCPIQAI